MLVPMADPSPDGGFPFMHAPTHVETAAVEEPFPWEMIGLGLEEPLPSQDVINEL
jgi:hypothetical protein